MAPAGPGLPRPDLLAEIEAQARADEAAHPAPVMARARTAVDRFRVAGADPDDIRHAALLLEAEAVLDVDVPTRSRLPGVTYLKHAVKRLVLFYVRFLAVQVTALGQAAARLGLAVANRVDRIDGDLVDLRARVAALEAAVGERPDGDRP